MKRLIIGITLISLILGCNTTILIDEKETPFYWENATIYFLMTDRFNDGDPSNNYQHTSADPPAPYRGYMGGDIRGITQKIKDGYFTDLGVDAIWLTPVVEQIRGSVDEGTGTSFGFHGYWTRDWTALDSKFGTSADLKEMVETAHKNGIRILMDVVANHTGPVTATDPVWPAEWVKTGPKCVYRSAESTINCTLVENLPDIKTEDRETEVELPAFLINKWKAEGRHDQEIAELDDWFKKTGYKRTPVNYILKWLVDFIKEYGVDGFRVDTVKHTEDYVWADLYKQAQKAYQDYQREHPDDVIDDQEFYMVGEVYNYFVSGGRDFDYGDRKVDFFKDGFKSLINFDAKYDAKKPYEESFAKYDRLLNGPLKGKSVVNYLSSHDDGAPFDADRTNVFAAGTRLFLTPGAVQLYYGDETARLLNVEAEGDAKLRSFMNWDELATNADRGAYRVQDVLLHYQKLGTFRQNNPSVGIGRHQMISSQPYVCSRVLRDDGYHNATVIGLDMPKGEKTITVSGVFSDGEKLIDRYSGIDVMVIDGQVTIKSNFDIVLLEKI